MVLIYAITVGITPEFDFLGIPKVRLTDLLLPFLLLSASGPAKNFSARSLAFTGVFLGLFCWYLACLCAWGKAGLTPGLFYLAKRFVFFLTAYCVARSISSVVSWNRIVRITVFASPLLSFTVLHELNSNLNSGSILATGEYMRASGIIANQQTSSALYIALTTCVALGCIGAFKDPFWKIACVVSMSTGCAAIFATGSRGGLVAVLIALVSTAVLRPRQGCGVLVLGLTVGLAAWTFTPGTLQERLSGLLPETQITLMGMAGHKEDVPEYGSSSIYDRLIVATYAVQTLLPQAGLMGLGAGFKKLGSIDNFYLMEWISHGFIGLCWWLCFQIAILVGCWRVAKTATDPVEKGVASGAVSAMLVMSASGFQGDSFFLIRPTEALSLYLGMVAARRAMRP
ncbi:hypothetical protein IV102_19515 [bacterium]|nr:hypothetical protein [bacterium]